jgi:hypothetical protein
MRKGLFRSTPPLEFVEGVFRAVGLLGLHDLRWWSKTDLRMDTVSDWLPELEAYYYPCKARRFLYERGDVTPDLLVTLLRHCAEAHEYKLVPQERVLESKGPKQTLYQIQPRNPFQAVPGATNGLVEFL